MSKVEVAVKTSNPDIGTFKKGEMVFQAKETVNNWKLVANSSIKIVFEWSKKDFSTFDEWVAELLVNGYEKA